MAFSARYNGWLGWNHLGIGLAGLLSLLALIYWQPSTAWPSTPIHVMQGLFTTLFLVGIGVYLYRIFKQIEFFSPEELIGFGLVFGTGTLLLGLLPALLSALQVPTAVSLQVALGAIQLSAATLFFMGGTFLLVRLATWKNKGYNAKLWRLFLIGLGVNLLFNFEGFTWSPIIRWVILAAAAIPALALIVQFHWITYLTVKGRKTIFIMLPLLALVSGALTYQLLQFPLADTFHIHFLQNHILLLTSGFVSVFSLLSLMALLFYIPLSGTFEMQYQALQVFGKMSKAAQTRGSEVPILSLLLEQSIQHSQAKAGWISLVDRSSPDDTCLKREHLAEADIKRIEYTLFCHPNHYGIDKAQQFIYIKDLQADPYMKYHLLDFRSLVCFNVRIEGNKLYRLYLLHPMAKGFDQKETSLISSYVTQATTALSNLFLLHETIEHERFKEDLAIGKQVQQRLLPEVFPMSEQLDIAATSVAAEEVGGDYYDYFAISPDQLAVIMADVSGKGTTAAFHVAEMKGIFQSLILSETEPASFLKKANIAVGRCFDKGMFITLIYGVLDTVNQTFAYTRAGHCPVLIYRGKSRTVELLDDDGLGLGILRDDSYDALVKQQQVPVEPGDAVIFYTDGITEARHPENKQEYGYDRLRDCLLINMDLPADKITAKVVQDIQQFTGQPMNRDDMSVMVIKC